MERFGIQGYYEYLGTKGELTGELKVNNDGTIEGDIIDHNSVTPNQKISGIIDKEKEEISITFLKFPKNQDLANILYGLTKKGKNKSVEGSYEGKWYAMPRALGTIIDTTCTDLTVTLLRMPQYHGGEKASLTLKKIK